MTALFKPIRRILSPRETERVRGQEDGPPDTPVSSTSSGQHRGSESDSVVVNNLIYSEPEPLDRVSLRGSGDDPPLPPRSPSSIARQADDHDTYYQAPVDTLGRSIAEQQLLRSSTRDRERAQERDRRNMDNFEKTMNQKAQQGAGGNPILKQIAHGHRRTRSGSNLIDNAEYSTPWDVQEEQQRRSTSGVPPKPHRHRSSGRPIPATPNDGTDNIIPISPTPILSSPHERSQSASPIPPHSPVLGGAESEYDDPWDVKNRKINQAIPSHGRHHGHPFHERRSSPPPSQLTGDHRPHMRQSVGSRGEPRSHLEEVRPARAMSDRNHHHRSAGVIETSTDQFRVRTGTDVVHGHSHGPLNPGSPRTSSISMTAHPIQKRPLPVEPVTTTANVSSCPLSTSSSTPRAEPSSPPSTWFDSNLALEEQPWYHGAITRAEAEAVLAHKPDFSFLVRNSESCRTDYSLSIRDRSSGFIHLRIVYERSGYVLGQFSSHFQTVPECIFFYTQQRLNIRGTEHKKLRYPVSRDRYRDS